MYKTLFGPVASRRLGRSLGVDLVPYKVCSYNCIYCQLGETTDLTIDRKTYQPTRLIYNEIMDFLKTSDSSRETDIISLAGSGEPTLAKNCGQVIRWIRDITPIPMAVLTNGSMLWREEVREDLISADIVLPSIDAVTDEVFQRINRPAPALSIEKILDGIEKFSKIFNGRLFPEVMVIEGFNDHDGEIKKIIQYLRKLNPDRVHLNVVERPGTDKDVKSPRADRMKEIASMFPMEIPVDIVGKSPHIFTPGDRKNIEEKILSHLARRPAVPGDLAAGLGVSPEVITNALGELVKQDKIIETPDRTDNYYYLKRRLS
ncbi:MAG: radical SAM protein [Candidatus Eremiobacteraeota bacterium]|nr:radical SAM protein [Candidatus Eremiobacteraeota bacterium]